MAYKGVCLHWISSNLGASVWKNYLNTTLFKLRINPPRWYKKQTLLLLEFESSVDIVFCRVIRPWCDTVFNWRFGTTTGGHLQCFERLKYRQDVRQFTQYCGTESVQYCKCPVQLGPKRLLITALDHGLIDRQRTILTQLTAAVRALEIHYNMKAFKANKKGERPSESFQNYLKFTV